MKFNHLLASSDKQAIIEVEGLARPLTIFHLTDCHLNETDDREGAGALVESIRAYGLDALDTRHRFERALAYADEHAVDCIALTGDAVNGATLGNLDYLTGRLEALQAPYLYTPGNHDWEYPFEPWSEETRKAQYPKFDRLTEGNPAFRALTLQGVDLLAVDNSTYQITDEQLSFVEKRLAGGAPTLLFMHIPIYVPSLLGDVMKDWNAPIMMAAERWDPELQAQWMVADATPATRAFYDLLMANPHGNLMGVCCGHVHFAHADAFGRGSCQYVTQAGFAGGYRIVRLVPLR